MTFAREMEEKVQQERGNCGEREGDKWAERVMDTEWVRGRGRQMRSVGDAMTMRERGVRLD